MLTSKITHCKRAQPRALSNAPRSSVLWLWGTARLVFLGSASVWVRWGMRACAVTPMPLPVRAFVCVCVRQLTIVRHQMSQRTPVTLAISLVLLGFPL